MSTAEPLLAPPITAPGDAVPAAPGRRFNVYVLPALLILLSSLLVGSYLEVNDDVVLVLFMRGLHGGGPTTDLRPFLPGLSTILAHLYQLAPAIPWYGLTLTLGLYVALVLLFGAVERVAPAHLRGRRLTGLLVVLFVFGFLDQVLCYNFTRPALLLGAGAVLRYAAGLADGQRGRALLGAGLAFILGLGIRADGAMLGVLAALPGAWLLASRPGGSVPTLGQLVGRIVAAIAPFALAIVAFFALTSLTRSPERVDYDQRKNQNCFLRDYNLHYPKATNPADSVRLTLVNEWMLGDKENITLDFYHRATGPDWGHFLGKPLRVKLTDAAWVVLKNFWPALLLVVLLLTRAWMAATRPGERLWLLAAPAVVGALLLTVGGLLKLPWRVASPATAVLLTISLLGYLRWRPGRAWRAIWPVWTWLVIAVAVIGQVYLVGSLRHDLAEKGQKSAELRATLARAYPNRTLVMSLAYNRLLRNPSPFHDVDFGTCRVLPLSGWHTLEPAYPPMLERFTGQRAWPAAINQLSHDPTTVWLLAPDFHKRFATYLRVLHHQDLPLAPLPGVDPRLPDLTEIPGLEVLTGTR